MNPENPYQQGDQTDSTEELSDEEKIESVKNELKNRGGRRNNFDWENEDLKKLAIMYWQYPEALFWVWAHSSPSQVRYGGEAYGENKEIFARDDVKNLILEFEGDYSGNEAHLASRIGELTAYSEGYTNTPEEKASVLKKYVEVAALYREAPGVVEIIGREIGSYRRNDVEDVFKFFQDEKVCEQIIDLYKNYEDFFYGGLKELMISKPSMEQVDEYIDRKMQTMESEIEHFQNFDDLSTLLEHIESARQTLEKQSDRVQLGLMALLVKKDVFSKEQIDTIKEKIWVGLKRLDEDVVARIRRMSNEKFFSLVHVGLSEWYSDKKEHIKHIRDGEETLEVADYVLEKLKEAYMKSGDLDSIELRRNLMSDFWNGGFSSKLQKLEHEHGLNTMLYGV